MITFQSLAATAKVPIDGRDNRSVRQVLDLLPALGRSGAVAMDELHGAYRAAEAISCRLK